MTSKKPGIYSKNYVNPYWPPPQAPPRLPYRQRHSYVTAAARLLGKALAWPFIGIGRLIRTLWKRHKFNKAYRYHLEYLGYLAELQNANDKRRR